MKIQTAIRIEESILKILKERAKSQHRSLNNYIEFILIQSIEETPNNETLKAMKDAENNRNLKEIKDLDIFFDNI